MMACHFGTQMLIVAVIVSTLVMVGMMATTMIKLILIILIAIIIMLVIIIGVIIDGLILRLVKRRTGVVFLRIIRRKLNLLEKLFDLSI